MNLEKKEQTCCLTNKDEFPLFKKDINIFTHIFWVDTESGDRDGYRCGFVLRWVRKAKACLR